MATRAANFAGALRQKPQASTGKKAMKAIGRMRMLAHVSTKSGADAAATAVRLKTGRGNLVGANGKDKRKGARVSLYKQKTTASTTRGRSNKFTFDDPADMQRGGAAGAAVAMDVDDADAEEDVDGTTGKTVHTPSSGYIKVAQTPKAARGQADDDEVEVDDFLPVVDVTHNRKLDYIGSWCADVVMIRDKTKGGRIRAYLAV